MTSTRTVAVDTARDAVPFILITVIWLVLSLALYGLFIVTKPDVDYAPWVHASVLLPGLIGLLGHTLRQSISVLSE
jgi:hypothetical protein